MDEFGEDRRDQDPGQTPPGERESLPEIQPPSAGFIVQLFVVPALIVGAIIGVYALFGRMAAGDLDWRQQVIDVRSQNAHVRWRGALGLAQMLDADAQRGEAGQGLAHNGEIASALTELFIETRGVTPRDEETEQQLEFLAKALGRLDATDVVLPVLLESVEQEEQQLRKHSLTAVAMVAGRALERGAPLDDPSLVRRTIAASEHADVLTRHQAAFTLGLLGGADARLRLEALLSDGDLMTRANAAIGLARSGSTLGLPVFEEVFADMAARPLDPAAVHTEPEAQEYFERKLALTNCVRAVEQISTALTPDERRRAAASLTAIAAATRDAQVEIGARQASFTLGAE
jgi:hypothetical protein